MRCQRSMCCPRAQLSIETQLSPKVGSPASRHNKGADAKKRTVNHACTEGATCPKGKESTTSGTWLAFPFCPHAPALMCLTPEAMLRLAMLSTDCSGAVRLPLQIAAPTLRLVLKADRHKLQGAHPYFASAMRSAHRYECNCMLEGIQHCTSRTNRLKPWAPAVHACCRIITTCLHLADVLTFF